MDVTALIAQSKKETETAKATLLKTFEFVPEDKLNWSPSSTARTPLQIVAHCGAANGAFAALLRGEPLPLSADPEEATLQIRNAGMDITTREGAVQLVEDSTAAVLQALDQVTEEKLGTSPESPFGAIPYPFWMHVPGDHMRGHAHQIDYIETIWGDYEDHR